MFAEISENMKARMAFLEKTDSQDRADGTERMKRLRQIPSETGKFIALLAVNCPDGEFIEVGTSAGYSTMWLSLAAKERNIRIKTHELLPEKIKLAVETFNQAEINEYVELIEGDALENLKRFDSVAFCFLDCEKEMYEECWDLLADKIVKNGLLIADNAISHFESLKPMIEKAMSNDDFDCMIIPIGKGELICRKK